MPLSAWWSLSAPAALLVVSLIPVRFADAHARVIATAGLSAGMIAFVVALWVDEAVIIYGPYWSPVLGAEGVGISVYFDALSAVMFSLVAFIGLIVLVYSRNYLDGDPRQGSFYRRLCFTLAAVLTVISAGNLAFLILAWIATSVGLNKLLLFYPERPAAQLAAKKKFITSRLGDLFLICAGGSLWVSFDTLAFPELLAAARAASVGTLALPAVLIVLISTES